MFNLGEFEWQYLKSELVYPEKELEEHIIKLHPMLEAHALTAEA